MVSFYGQVERNGFSDLSWHMDLSNLVQLHPNLSSFQTQASGWLFVAPQPQSGQFAVGLRACLPVDSITYAHPDCMSSAALPLMTFCSSPGWDLT